MVSEPMPALVEAMLDPGFYLHDPASVELRESHISWVFRAGNLAYKVKKPVFLPFLDYSTLEHRREMCEREIRLNRRLAPRTYLRVVGILAGGGGFSLGSARDPAVVEYALEMRSVEEDRSLEALSLRGELTSSQIIAVAARLARFHAEAPVVAPDTCSLSRFLAAITDNAATMRRVGKGVLDKDRLSAAAGFTATYLASNWVELEQRMNAGRLRECHGDLRAEHVIVPLHAPLYVFDCVEFAEHLRKIDVSADLAFLIMDLVRLGEADLAQELLSRYRAEGGEPGSDSLVAFFAAYRSWVRATVACERAQELRVGDPERHRQAASASLYLALGHQFAWRTRRPRLLIVCGVAASGKSTLAELLSELSGWPRLSSDEMRKQLAGMAASARGGEEIYEPRWTAKTYRELGRASRAALASGTGAIVDATFHLRAEREWFEEGLEAMAPTRTTIRCVASKATLLHRAAERERERRGTRVSDAGAAIVIRQLQEYEPFDCSIELPTEMAPPGLATLVERHLDRAP